MQPTYLPWIGYLAMIDRVDQFVFLDSVPFNSRSWQQRNYIRSGDEKRLLTVPVSTKGLSGQLIRDVDIVSDAGFPAKHIRSIEMNYSTCPFFSEYSEGLFECYFHSEGKLNRLNQSIILWFCKVLNIETPICTSSELNSSGSKADLLAGICDELGADQYLSAPGSKSYIEESLAFVRRGISVEYHEYEHPEYAQFGKGFIPYIASIDLLFNVGADEALRIIRSGVSEFFEGH
ncbi:WbqC family protein [Thalassospira sp.]|uniref:WbqC family protein n=1 Tax=Thalassospira sp. TaxID=1912094 RepID=UPI001B0AAA37|nr:WbqC family protein [Thalassospira sp.]MBO6805968.1 WbqC family protein [Thalassospira sp.]